MLAQCVAPPPGSTPTLCNDVVTTNIGLPHSAEGITLAVIAVVAILILGVLLVVVILRRRRNPRGNVTMRPR